MHKNLGLRSPGSKRDIYIYIYTYKYVNYASFWFQPDFSHPLQKWSASNQPHPKRREKWNSRRPLPRYNMKSCFPASPRSRIKKIPMTWLKCLWNEWCWNALFFKQRWSNSWCQIFGGEILELEIYWVVVSNIFYFHPYLGRWSNLTSIFFRWVETTN